ncbi:branched chain amino acid aminotransferase [Alteromonas sp. D210916BOD_24]|uniref:sulfotransferase-like domain-containing protein n=1 Tax=Alteromonas sp. D210916BOD_24 TaxID=3157618 RepID=UPI00399D0627
MRIAMWSGPRNLSTAMMYAFAARSDCAVIDEPFYAAYLTATGLQHPMQQAIIEAQPSQPEKVIAQCLGEYPDNKPLFYQKHMTHHMVESFPLDWLDELTNVFLIRHPARVVASYQQKRESPTLSDIGFARQLALFNTVKSLTGNTPVVIDSDDILKNPAKALAALCDAIGIEYQSQMLSWPKGGNAADGVWASHWYASVWESTGLTTTPAKPLPQLNGELGKLVQDALPYYELMAKNKLRLGLVEL